MEKRLTADLNVVANSNLEIQLLDGDLNIIQKLDDEPNDVGGLTSAELKAKFDESGNIIKKYINETLIPSVLTDDATEESRKQAEAARVAAEQGRVTAEEGRVSAETARVSAETARQSAETARSGAESTRQSKENARQTAETARANAETARQAAETRRGEAETARASAESERRNAESSRVTAEGGRASAETSRVTAEQGRTSAESIRVQDEQKRVSAENSRVEAEAQRAAAEQARADENTGIVAQATAQANAAAGSAESASASAKTAQSASRNAGTAASTASSAASTASTAAEAASSSASQAQASATAAAQSAASVDGINKTAQSWAVGGTNTRPGEDTDNAKYWAEQAQAVVGGDFATKVEAQGYVTAHNQSADAHADIRKALAEIGNGGETFVIQADAAESGDTLTMSGWDKTLSEINAARQAGKAIRLRLNFADDVFIELPLTGFGTGNGSTYNYIFGAKNALGNGLLEALVSFTGETVRGQLSVTLIPSLSGDAPAAPGTAFVGTSDFAARADHVHPKEVSDDDRAAWNGKASKPTATTVTLSATGWNSSTKQQTVAVSGILADGTKQRVICSPVDESYDSAWNSCYVQCVGHGADSLTFQCDEIPTAAIEVYVSIQPVSFAS